MKEMQLVCRSAMEDDTNHMKFQDVFQSLFRALRRPNKARALVLRAVHLIHDARRQG